MLLLQNLKPHISQSRNNCGPSSLYLAASHLGLSADLPRVTQAIHSNPGALVTLSSLEKGATLIPGFAAKRLTSGTFSQFINSLVHSLQSQHPLIVLSRLALNNKIGHFRVIVGLEGAPDSLVIIFNCPFYGGLITMPALQFFNSLFSVGEHALYDCSRL